MRVEIPWDKIEREIFNPHGACISVDFDTNTSRKRCWLCGVNPSQPCLLNTMEVTANNDTSREWLMLYVINREAARAA